MSDPAREVHADLKESGETSMSAAESRCSPWHTTSSGTLWLGGGCSPVTATTGKLAIFREQVGDVPSAVNYRDDLHLLEATTVR